jgi:hypothetical protein
LGQNTVSLSLRRIAGSFAWMATVDPPTLQGD